MGFPIFGTCKKVCINTTQKKPHTQSIVYAYENFFLEHIMTLFFIQFMSKYQKNMSCGYKIDIVQNNTLLSSYIILVKHITSKYALCQIDRLLKDDILY